jgi:hypothetical protein
LIKLVIFYVIINVISKYFFLFHTNIFLKLFIILNSKIIYFHLIYHFDNNIKKWHHHFIKTQHHGIRIRHRINKTCLIEMEEGF